MDREDLARELNVQPWDVDDWLLWGCPAQKVRNQWEFDLDQVRSWLRTQRIRIKRTKNQSSPIPPPFDSRWLGKRCPVCIERGFPGEQAGLLYTDGEIFEGAWHLRRTGVPCGHSTDWNDRD